MKKPPPSQGESAPLWIITYADMITLLMGFFVIMLGFSEPKKDQSQRQVAASIAAALNGIPMGQLPPTLIQQLEEAAIRREKFHKAGPGEAEAGLGGRETTIQLLNDGLQFTIGGLITFEPGCADLKPEAKAELVKIAMLIQGQNNQVEIRGHVSGMDLSPGSAYATAFDLSYARAVAVMNFLTIEPQSIRRNRIRLAACADGEPLVRRVYDEPHLALNRRVEIKVTEKLISDDPSPTNLLPPTYVPQELSHASRADD